MRIHILLVLLLTGCASLNPWADDPKEEEKEKSEESEDGGGDILDVFNIRPNDFDLLQRKYAQMWAKVDEMEVKLAAVTQRMKVVEQSSRLGLPIPPELPADEPMEVEQKNQEVVPKETPMPIADKDKSSDKEAFDKRYMEARKTFGEGRYGMAYVAFTNLKQDFKEEVTKGIPLFWMGRTWLMLGDYDEAKSTFEQFIAEYPGNPLVANSMYHLARAELKIGMRSQAVATLQKIIKIYPFEAASEAAKQMLINMKDTL